MSLVDDLHAAHKERMRRIEGAAVVPFPKAPKPEPDHSPYWEEFLALLANVKNLTERVEALEAQSQFHKSLIGQFIAAETDEKPKFGEIISCVCEYYKITRHDLLSARRTQELSLPRQIICFLGRDLTGMSFPQMGRRLGGRDHTTALHGANQIRTQLETDEVLKDDIDVLKMKIGAKVMERRFGSNVAKLS